MSLVVGVESGVAFVVAFLCCSAFCFLLSGAVSSFCFVVAFAILTCFSALILLSVLALSFIIIGAKGGDIRCRGVIITTARTAQFYRSLQCFFYFYHYYASRT